MMSSIEVREAERNLSQWLDDHADSLIRGSAIAGAHELRAFGSDLAILVDQVRQQRVALGELTDANKRLRNRVAHVTRSRQRWQRKARELGYVGPGPDDPAGHDYEPQPPVGFEDEWCDICKAVHR